MMPFLFLGTYDENWLLPESLTLEEYRHVIFRPDAHFIEGQVIARQLGSFEHSSTVGRLIERLHDPLRSDGCHLCVSLRLQVSATRIRVCDLVALKADAPREDVPTVAPLLCVEVLEHGQSPQDEADTLADYSAMGVENIWLIDPERKKFFLYRTAVLHEVEEFEVSRSMLRIPAETFFAPAS